MRSLDFAPPLVPYQLFFAYQIVPNRTKERGVIMENDLKKEHTPQITEKDPLNG